MADVKNNKKGIIIMVCNIVVMICNYVISLLGNPTSKEVAMNLAAFVGLC